MENLTLMRRFGHFLCTKAKDGLEGAAAYIHFRPVSTAVFLGAVFTPLSPMAGPLALGLGAVYAILNPLSEFNESRYYPHVKEIKTMALGGIVVAGLIGFVGNWSGNAAQSEAISKSQMQALVTEAKAASSAAFLDIRKNWATKSSREATSYPVCFSKDRLFAVVATDSERGRTYLPFKREIGDLGSWTLDTKNKEQLVCK